MNAEYRNPLSPTDLPPLRRVTANILTGLGWLHGTFHLPPHQSLVDFLAPGVQRSPFSMVNRRAPPLRPARSSIIPGLGSRRNTGT
jgi:hypothetical protein